MPTVTNKAVTVAWISDFPIEWINDVPAALRHLPRRHPATWQLVLLGEFQKDPRIKLHVILFRGQIERDFSFEQNGTVFHVLKASPKMRLASWFWLDTFRIRKVCKEINPDLVHAWGSEKGASLIARRLPYPYVMTIQGLFAWYKQIIKLPLYDRIVEYIERVSLRHAPVVTTESNFAVKFLQEHFPGPKIHQAEHAPNHAFHRVQRHPLTHPVNFVSIGSVSHRKGTDLLFAAAEQLSGEFDFTLTIITNPVPGYIQSLETTISERTKSRIKFKHHLQPHEVARELETATMLLMPTRADTSPNAVKEAAVAGVPVVASTVGGIPDYIVHEKNGILFQPDDLEAFVKALRTACAHPLFSKGLVDPETLAKQREYLSPELMARNFFRAYESALALGQ